MQTTAYEMRIRDWSSDVCSSDLGPGRPPDSDRRGARPFSFRPRPRPRRGGNFPIPVAFPGKGPFEDPVEGAVLQVLVLGAAAGGGFPQWYSNNEASRRARRGDSLARPSSQSSVAVSADGENWILLNASPDLRQQIFERRQLHPRDGVRHSPIRAVVLTNGDVDHVAGLLTLRESHPLAVYATDRVLSVLEDNAIFNVLNPAFVARRRIRLGDSFEPQGQEGEGLGLAVTPLAVPGKVALSLADSQEIGRAPCRERG